MIRLSLPLIALAALAGCVAAAPAPPGAGPSAPAEADMEPVAACTTRGLEDLIGQKPTDRVLAAARQRSGATVVRVLRPDMMVTMEYRADRLNLHTDVKGAISDIRCG